MFQISGIKFMSSNIQNRNIKKSDGIRIKF